jgi:hypothetical protein
MGDLRVTAQQRPRKPTPAELVDFARREFPDAERSAAAHGARMKAPRFNPLEGLRRAMLRQHKVAWLYWGWSRGSQYEGWQCLLASGPRGLVRLSPHSEALRQFLQDEAPARIFSDPEGLSALLAAVMLSGEQLERSSSEALSQEAQAYSAVLTQDELFLIDGGYLVPVQHKVWKAMRSGIALPQLETLPGCLLVSFDYLEGTEHPAGRNASLFRLLRCRCTLAAGSHAVSWQTEEIAQVGFRMPAIPMRGRELRIDGRPRRAALVGGDW